MPNPVDPVSREVRSFLHPRDPSIDRRFRPRPDRKVELFRDIKEEDNEDDFSYPRQSVDDDSECASTASLSTQEVESALIYLRIRPVEEVCPSYEISGQVLITKPLSDNNCTTNNKNQAQKHFMFTEIFKKDAGQAAVYDKCIGNKIELEEDFTMFTYGTSGSGKTFSIIGDLHNPGIIPRALENIFTLYSSNLFPQPAAKLSNASVIILDDDAMHKQMLIRASLLSSCAAESDSLYTKLQRRISEEHSFATNVLENTSVFIWISFVEIYNEMVYDLLSPLAPATLAKRRNLKIVSNDGKVFIKDLTSMYTKNGCDAYKLLTYGLQKVQYASTSINTNSSRSHCIFFVDVIKFTHPDIFSVKSYKFCDLAGSERLGKTGNIGCRLKEAQRINTSLMVLGRCLDAANNNQRKKNTDLIPVRESKLTMLLQSALLGKEKLVMIVNITPIERYFEENQNVLGFASIAMNIVYKPLISKRTDRSSRYSFLASNSNVDSAYTTLIEENISLRNEISRLQNHLQNELVHQEFTLRNKLIDDFQKRMEHRKALYDERLELEISRITAKYEAKITALESERNRLLEELADGTSETVEKKRRTSASFGETY